MVINIIHRIFTDGGDGHVRKMDEVSEYALSIKVTYVLYIYFVLHGFRGQKYYKKVRGRHPPPSLPDYTPAFMLSTSFCYV